jgi:hypothetical protein
MTQKLTEFNLVYDPRNAGMVAKKWKTQADVGEVSNKAYNFHVRHPGCKIYLKKKDAMGDIEVLFSTDEIFDEAVLPMAEFRAFSKTADLGYFRTDGLKNLVASSPDDGEQAVGALPVNIAEYYNGKMRRATNGGGFEFQCRITIQKNAWETIKQMGAGGGIKQIEGILQQDPILISQKSQVQGARCIKPEPYGWIFSTSVNNRLVAKNVPVTTVNPTELIFSVVETGH